ncbi:MAG: hypothetical protein RL213_1881 [Bacteroidota bacterium]|jgi:hypothetical protein
MADYLIAFLVAFVFFGFVRRFFYVQAYRSFTKAREDFFRNGSEIRKPEGTVILEQRPAKTGKTDESVYTEWEEVK